MLALNRAVVSPKAAGGLALAGGTSDQHPRREGARIQAPKALSEVGSGEGCPLPIRLWDLGEHHELSQRGPGRSPGRKRILAYFRVTVSQNTTGRQKNSIFGPV